MRLICGHCGETFERSRRQPYCSKRCSGLATTRRGTESTSYNGGLSFNPALRRWVIKCRDGSWMYYYRGVMAAHIGRLLEPHELVHHVNEDTTDDRIENLALTTRSEHMKMHMPKLLAARA